MTHLTPERLHKAAIAATLIMGLASIGCFLVAAAIIGAMW